MNNWVTFIGEGRSGHTILSAIIDSHPNARMSEEQKYISKWHREKWNRDKILEELLKSGYGKERKPKALPGMLTFEDPLLIVGDKCGWDAVNEVRKREAPLTILQDFSKHMRMPVKVIHSSRNPFDNISAWLDSAKYQRMYKDSNVLCRRMIRRYDRFYGTAQKLINSSDVYHIRNEELCSNPEGVLVGMCDFLDIKFNSVWLKNAVTSITKKPNQRSLNRVWPGDYEKRIWNIIEKYPSLWYYKGE